MRRAAAILAGFIVAVALWTLRGDDESGAPAADPSLPADVRTSSAGRLLASRRSLPATATPGEVITAPEMRRGDRVTGVVVRDGAPIAGALVRASHHRHEPVEVTTGPSGRFEVNLEGWTYAHIEATAGPEWRGTAFGWLSAGEPREFRIELVQASVIDVFVTGPDGQPVEGARVECGLPEDDRGDPDETEQRWAQGRSGPVETARDGRATLSIILAGKYEIEAEHSELGVVVEERVLEFPAERRRVDLQIRGGSVIRGRAVEAGSIAVPNVEILLSPTHVVRQYGFRQAVTGADGRFTIMGVEAGTYTLEATSALCEPEKVSFVNDGRDLEIEVPVRATRPITGRVLDRQNHPLRGWAVIVNRESVSEERPEITSHADGTFALEACVGERYALTAARPDFDRGQELIGPSAHSVSAVAGDRDVVLRGGEGATLELEVRFVGRDPPESYTVSVNNRDYAQPGAVEQVRLEGLSAGVTSIEVSATGFDEVSEYSELSENEVRRLSLTLRPGLAFSGRVVDAETRAAVPYPEVWISRRGSWGSSTKLATRGDAEGRFNVEELGAGPIGYRVSARSYVSSDDAPVDVVAGLEPIVVALRRGVIVKGRVRRGPLPFGEALVALSSHEEAAYRPGTDSWTRADGTFTIDGSSPGRWRLDVTKFRGERSPVTKTMIIDVPPAGLDGLDVDIGNGPRLTIRPTQPVVDFVSLELSRAGVISWYLNLDAGSREYIVEGLTPGKYVLERLNGAPAHLDITISGSNSVEVTMP